MVILITSNILSWLSNYLLYSKLLEDPQHYKLVGTNLTITGQNNFWIKLCETLHNVIADANALRHIATENFNSTSSHSNHNGQRRHLPTIY